MTKVKLTKIGVLVFSFLITFSLIFLFFFVSNKMKAMGLSVSLPEMVKFTIENRKALIGGEDLQENVPGQEPEVEKVKEIPQLKKDSTGKYTNFLIVGFDTRGENSGLRNTDSIIVANYNHETNHIVLISIPRDVYGVITIPNSSSVYYNKINAAYSYGENRQAGLGMETLKLTVEKTIGQEIQYTVSINYVAFEEIINLLGGVEVNVENSFVDYHYPGPTSYITVRFDQGLQTMDGEKALQYARSRKSMQNGEGSDFARARRQQRLIEAVKNKALQTDLFNSPTKIVSLLDTLSKNIWLSDYTLDDLEAALALKDKIATAEVSNFVLDPTIGNYSILTTGVGTGYTIGPKKGTKNYSDVHAFVAKAIQYPELYSNPPKIFTYDTGIGVTEAKATTERLKAEFPFIDIRYWGLLHVNTDGIVTFRNIEDYNENAFNYVAKFLGEDVGTVRPEGLPALRGEHIVVLVGKKAEVVQETNLESSTQSD